MAERTSTSLPILAPEQRRIAAETFERAKDVLASRNFDYAINLLRQCCKLDPGNFVFRQTLRRAQKEKYGNSMRGSPLAFVVIPGLKAKLKGAKASRDYVAVLEHGEDVLFKNPWDLGAQMDMAEAFDALGLGDLAIFSLDQARQKYPNDATLNRALARLFEKRGDYQKAIALWQLVQKADPKDLEAASKGKNLAASETIARGGYEDVIAGTKESPVVGRMESSANQNKDRASRETEALQKRIEADPTETSLYIQLANLYRRSNQFDRARAALQQGLGPTGKHDSLQLELLELDLVPLRAKLEAADSRYKRAKASADGDADDDGPSLTELAETRSSLKREVLTREADLLRFRAERFPAEVGHRYELGVRLLKLDRIDEAIAELQQAKRDDKLKGVATMTLGLCFRKRNSWKLAHRNFEEALGVLTGPSDEGSRKEVLYQLATGLAEQGDIPRAIELGHELANIDFGFRGIGSLIDDWEAKLAEV